MGPDRLIATVASHLAAGFQIIRLICCLLIDHLVASAAIHHLFDFLSGAEIATSFGQRDWSGPARRARNDIVPLAMSRRRPPACRSW